MPDDIAAVLRASPVFSDVPERELAALATTAREQTYRAREYVFMENDPADWFCFVRAGRVKILRTSRGGRDMTRVIPVEAAAGVFRMKNSSARFARRRRSNDGTGLER
jgi:CRP/FNR family transcriptional regulator